MQFSPSIFDRFLDWAVVLGYTRWGYLLRAGSWQALPSALRDQNVMVTGANAGIGFACARLLAATGATVHLVCRSAKRGESARAKLSAEFPETTIRLWLADLSDLDQIQQLAKKFGAEFPVLDALINNAGIMVHKRYEAPDGAELTFAVNTRAYAVLTECLRPALAASPSPRVVMVSSGGMYPVPLQLADPMFEQREYDGVRAYAESKRAEVVLAEMFAERYGKDGILVSSMHPGWVDTDALAQGLPKFYKFFRRILRSPEQGADTAAWLAIDPRIKDAPNGKFWHDRRIRPAHRRNSTRENRGERDQLWSLCFPSEKCAARQE